jgi:hypothetical protein
MWDGVIKLSVVIDNSINLTMRKEISAKIKENTINIITLINGFM